MGQVTIYLEKEIEEKMRLAAKSENLSQSKWIANLISEKVANQWPENVKSLAGAWRDFPTLSQIREHESEDSTREDL